MLKSNFKFYAFPAWLLLGIILLTQCHSLCADEIVYDSGKRRDPFVPITGEDASVSATSSSGIKLEGIIYDPNNRSMAILNGKTFQQGESIGDATIVKIQKDHVVISISGEEKTLFIRQEEKS